MSTTLMLPACDRPGSNTRPGFRAGERDGAAGAHRGAVHRAGETVDTRRDVDRDHRSAPRARAGRRTMPRRLRARRGSRCRTSRRPRRRRAPSARASPRRSTPDASSTTCTRMPQRSSAVAVTRPSPPLLPFPHTTTARRPYTASVVRRTSHATARPARSMSTRDRRAGRDRALVGASHRFGREDGLARLRPRPRSPPPSRWIPCG